MSQRWTTRVAALSLTLIALPLPIAAAAADRVKVGFLSTMSGPSGYFGNEARDGFNLLVKMKSGRLGGLPAEVIVADDQLSPDVGKQSAAEIDKRIRAFRDDA